jgi:hypothetical protein
VVDRLRELMAELDVVEMGAGQRAHDDEHYAKAGAEWYAAVAQVLRDGRAGGAVFNNRRVVGDLTSRKWRMRSDGRFELEPKHEIRKRGGRSPDWGDAVAMCFPRRPEIPWRQIQLERNKHARQRSREAAAPIYVLNRQTKAIELKRATQEQALSSDQPQLPRRKTFESAFEQRVRVEYLNLEASIQLLKRRVTGLPVPFVCLIYTATGGLARDLIRAAREMLAPWACDEDRS